ncbi:hypothetical protein C8024_00080 [Sphingopyxis sp. BSNA05]|nr:hypothetical protein [Sphingopyxis sp. BSNA05]
MERVAPLRRTLCNIFLAREDFTVAAFDLDVTLASDIFKMGFDMTTALLPPRHFDQHFGRAAHNPRQLGPSCFTAGRPIAGIERDKRLAIQVMDIAHPECGTGRFPQC